MSKKYKISKYGFESKATYEKARRELEFLSGVQKRYPLNQDNALAIRGILKENETSLQSKIGLDYLNRLESYLKESERIEKRARHQRKIAWFLQANLSIIAGVLAFLLCIVGVYTFLNFYSSYRSNKKVRELQSLIVRVDKDKAAYRTAETIETTEPIFETAIEMDQVPLDVNLLEAVKPVLLPEYSELYARNNDLAGWLTIEGTAIDYPVMWTGQDSSYYLSHNFDREEDKNGLLSLDFRCNIEDAHQNYLIHGHNMKSGTMFGSLKKYKEASYYREHKYITFDTIYQRGSYEIVAVFISQIFDSDSDSFKYYDCLDMSEETEYRYFIENLDGMKLYDTDAVTQFGDTFIMLSTCDYSRENGRLVVVAKRMEGTS